ncbi:6-carboxytetrahydropterin synthase QueD [Wohlfahrtiimonas chitiniclastica]|uniref:6-carboxytetrahydropterin synthase QueD n=1 Tax=Wohlfahrtiimonas chitiniclastica TaxID=400946 RepID=UPI00035D3900|nr:6-carboxytetrahydropterin synthase QueD [Wohlfahrtiimonas chitiniclastica]
MLQQFYPTVTHAFRYELNKDMHFAAAHFIPNESAGVCQRVHGHTYFANVTIAGDQLDECGFLVNFQTLKHLVHGEYDHTLLNDHADFNSAPPSTEIVAECIWRRIQDHLNQLDNQPRCVQILVRETPTTYVRYLPRAEDFA